jgi:molybdopterin/thiamine biosynthesis adenylyltransferase
MTHGSEQGIGQNQKEHRMKNDGLFARIMPLFDVGLLSEAKVLIAGCGSGGSQVALQLAMAGIRKFALFDSDVLEVENIIRHACGHRYLGQLKIDALADLLRDRNPSVEVECNNVDLMKSADLLSHVRRSTVVVLATDNEPTRYLLNELCVNARVPFVVGRVFTRGIGGEVFSYRPNKSGCLACLEAILERSQFRDGIREVDLVSEEEREKMYGLEVAEIRDSPGLNVDISFITSFHTRFTLEAIARTLPERPKHLLPIESDYVIWGNRPVHPFKKHFEVQRLSLAPQDDCRICGNGAPK